MLKKTIYILLLISSVGMMGFYIKKHFISKTNYARMFVTFGHSNIPFVEVDIQGKTYPFAINLNFTRYPLYLGKDILSQIAKKASGTVKIDHEGDDLEFQTYLLPKIKIGDIDFTDLQVLEIDPDAEESINRKYPIADIGLKFFEKKNLLLDFSNSTIIASDDLNKLKKVGYSIEDMTKTDYEIGPRGLILAVETDIGLVKLCISTSNTWSLIRSDLIKEKEIKDGPQGWQIVTTSTFAIGAKDFGSKDLYLYDISPSYGADGCIGMDFLKRHVIYLDFRNKTAYIAES